MTRSAALNLLDERHYSARDERVFKMTEISAMAKGQKRSSREAKKPKKERPKETATASPFSKQSTGGTPKQGSGKGETPRVSARARQRSRRAGAEYVRSPARSPMPVRA